MDDTDWRQIVELYDLLRTMSSSPVVSLNRAVAVAEISGPLVGLELIEGLDLDEYCPLHAVRADFLRRLQRVDEASLEYEAAIARTKNSAEIAYLKLQLERL